MKERHELMIRLMMVFTGSRLANRKYWPALGGNRGSCPADRRAPYTR